MNPLRHLNPPVTAFVATVCIGWGVSLYLNEWWWLALGLVFGLVIGDLVDALMPEPEPPKTKSKGPKRNG